MGLQFSFFDRTDLGRFNLTLSSYKAFDMAIIIVLSISGVIIVTLVIFALSLYWISSPLTLLFYVLYLISMAVLFVTLTLYVFGLEELHFHHWTVFLILTTVLCHQNQFISMCHGISLGIFTEGIARYGYDAVWESLYLQGRIVKL